MKYALILQTDFQNPTYWVCYGLSGSLRRLLLQNKCFDPSAKLYLDKHSHRGKPLEQVELPSCANGVFAPFIICKIEWHPGLAYRFEL
ncbi:hypothetical protein [uncultured Pontibacter sp.]|uniref:hypothetical protein n=1 Tax=uncultured Pontibacter sp. TaxID=453356 RepID=UPI0026355572|nr:hypothetical protein [uncultured Pontibacter sp.]